MKLKKSLKKYSKNIQLFIIILLLGIIFIQIKFPNILTLELFSRVPKVETIKSEEVVKSQQIALFGTAISSKRISIRSQIDGKIAKIIASNGDYLNQGDLIIELDSEGMEVIRNYARASLLKAKINHKNAQGKFAEKLISKQDMELAEVELQLADMNLKKAEIDLLNTQIVAPFEGYVTKINAVEGDVIKAYDSVLADFLNDNPMVIVAHISSFKIANLYNDMNALVKLSDGLERTGKLRYVANAADRTNGSYRVEVEVANYDGLIKDGTTAELLIETGKIYAYKIPVEVLTFNKDGDIGVKMVNEENIVEFYPVKIVSEESDAIYVTSLPKGLQIIVDTNEVQAGDKVEITNGEVN